MEATEGFAFQERSSPALLLFFISREALANYLPAEICSAFRLKSFISFRLSSSRSAEPSLGIERNLVAGLLVVVGLPVFVVDCALRHPNEIAIVRISSVPKIF